MLKLNLGCGTNILPGWVNVDYQDGPGVDVVCDLEDKEPGYEHCLVGYWDSYPRAWWEQGSVDEMLLSHVIEHLHDPLAVMKKLWHVAKPGCKLTIRCPHGASDDAWEDPTHVRPYFLQSFGYFSQPYHWRSGGYGYTADWQPEQVLLMVAKKHLGCDPDAFAERTKHERNLVREMVAILRKVDPPRPRKRELIEMPEYRIELCAS